MSLLRSLPLRAILAFSVAAVAAVGACGTRDAGDVATPTPPPAEAGPDASVPPIEAGLGHPLCVGGRSADGQYPKADYAVTLLGTLPDLPFDTTLDDGSPGKLWLHDYYEPCAARSRLIVLRVSAAWCGTCRWNVAHTGEIAKLDIGPRLALVDLLLSGIDGAPATLADLPAWRARIDAPQKIAVDRAFPLRAVLALPSPLPLIVLVDSRTMTIRNFLTNPEPELFELRVRQELATLDRAPQPPQTSPAKMDKLFAKNQWDMLKEMTLPGAPPADTTNAKADDPAAAALGKSLFGDASLSPSLQISCTRCHDAGQHFQDGLPQSSGAAKGDRNTPSVTLASHARWQFWDGRADTLWAQALGPLENPKEHASSRLFVAHAVADRYASAYTAVFGALPPLGDTARFPLSGKPGDAQWTSMSPADQDAATRVFVNVGKSIAAYERTLRVLPNALDAYAGGDLAALTPAQKNGLLVFFSVGCAQCHYGPRLTDDAFHVLRFPTGRQDGRADRGRLDGLSLLLASEFLSSGPFSDDRAARHGLGLTLNPSVDGAFKTPSLRGVASTAPYGHGGTLATLGDVAMLYGTAGLPAADPRASGVVGPWLPEFDHFAAASLVPFLGVLTADVAP